MALGASANKSASGTCSEHVWRVPKEAQPVEKSVIACINKLTCFFRMAHIWHTVHLRPNQDQNTLSEKDSISSQP